MLEPEVAGDVVVCAALVRVEDVVSGLREPVAGACIGRLERRGEVLGRDRYGRTGPDGIPHLALDSDVDDALEIGARKAVGALREVGEVDRLDRDVARMKAEDLRTGRLVRGRHEQDPDRKSVV